MATLIQTSVTESRGTPRVWVEGERLAREGIRPGMILSAFIEHGRMILSPASVQAKQQGRTVTVSKRTRRGKITPLIEIRLPDLIKLFGLAARVVVKIVKGRLSISRHHLDDKIARRETRFIERITEGKPLEVSSLYHGGGVLSRALHDGFTQSGVANGIKLAAEIEPKYLDASLSNNRDIFLDNAIILNAPMEQLAFTSSGMEMDVCEGGVPCSGASRAGRASNGLMHPEEHDSAGAQFYAYLRMIEILNPAICFLENVCEYRRSASYAIVCATLKMLGYRLMDRVVNGNDFGVLENRDRMVMVAISEGLEVDFDLNAIEPVREKEATLAEVLEPAAEAEREAEFRDYAHLREKEERDRKAGKGFMRNLLTPEADKVPTLVRDYAKAGSTSAQLQHPTNPLLTRLLTVLEHTRVKGIPAPLVSGLPKTVAHSILGQSVIYPAFVALAKSLGRSLRQAFAPQLISPVKAAAAA